MLIGGICFDWIVDESDGRMPPIPAGCDLPFCKLQLSDPLGASGHDDDNPRALPPALHL